MTLAARPGAFQDATRTPRRVAARLAFSHGAGRTFLAGQKTPHPFHITRTFHLEGDPAGAATLYLQSSAGGLYGDDDLSIAIEAGEGAFAHVTTQASTVVPPGRGGTARHAASLKVAAGATLEYLPDPLILFDGARVRTSLDVALAPGARAIVADGLVLHRPGGGPVDATFDNRIAIRWDGDARTPLIERQQAAGEGLRAALSLPSAPNTPLHYAALYLAGAEDPDAAATAIRSAAGGDDTFFGVTALPAKGLVIARMLAGSGARLTKTLDVAWRAARAILEPDLTPRSRRK